MNPCKKCGSTERKKDGNCAPCGRVYCKRWRAEHPEKSREYTDRRTRNPELDRERARERARQLWATNPDKKLAADRRYRTANPEKYREYSRKWAAANPEKARANTLAVLNKRKAARLAHTRMFSALEELTNAKL